MSKTPDLLSCGHSLDQLSDYLAAGKQPADPYIDACAECQAALHALEQLNTLTRELVDHDSQAQSEEDTDWLGSIFSNIAFEARAGRDIPLHAEPVEAEADPEDELSQTEGSVIALIRAVGDELDGAMIGRCRLIGELADPGSAVIVDVRVTALWGPPLRALADELRLKIRETLEQHTQLKISAIDISIVDILHETNQGVGD
ncbi:hypothetical protein [Psychromicrobium sp. YIM B11713]|uniref:hypothetical protein n=1 Tax=Psychromicrobium sp. YIM B11713 TaxID=3145233 RepID=UPI00374FA101